MAGAWDLRWGANDDDNDQSVQSAELGVRESGPEFASSTVAGRLINHACKVQCKPPKRDDNGRINMTSLIHDKKASFPLCLISIQIQALCFSGGVLS